MDGRRTATKLSFDPLVAPVVAVRASELLIPQIPRNVSLSNLADFGSFLHALALIGNELCGRRAGRIQWTVLWSCAAGSTSIVIFSYEFDLPQLQLLAESQLPARRELRSSSS